MPNVQLKTIQVPLCSSLFLIPSRLKSIFCNEKKFFIFFGDKKIHVFIREYRIKI